MKTNNRKIRIISAMMTVILLILTISSCSAKKEPGETTGTSGVNEATTAPENTLPQRDYNGADFTVLVAGYPAPLSMISNMMKAL